jgi:hypothetical protein
MRLGEKTMQDKATKNIVFPWQIYDLDKESEEYKSRSYVLDYLNKHNFKVWDYKKIPSDYKDTPIIFAVTRLIHEFESQNNIIFASNSYPLLLELSKLFPITYALSMFRSVYMIDDSILTTKNFDNIEEIDDTRMLIFFPFGAQLNNPSDYERRLNRIFFNRFRPHRKNLLITYTNNKRIDKYLKIVNIAYGEYIESLVKEKFKFLRYDLNLAVDEAWTPIFD